MSVFEIDELREHIFSYLYPKIIKKGMWIEIIDSDSKLQLQRRIPLQIFRIVKNEDSTYTIIIKKEYAVPEDHINWYCVYSYLYPYHGDIIKVIKYD